MNITGMWPMLAIAGAIALGLIGFGVFAVAVFLGFKLYKGKTTPAPALAPHALHMPSLGGLLGGLGKLEGFPLVQEMEKILLPAFQQYQQAWVNAALAKLFPPLVPFLPVIDKALADVENQILNIGKNAAPKAG